MSERAGGTGSGSGTERVTTREVRAMKGRGDRIAVLTAYDYPMARLVDQAGVDMILVGDTLGMVVLGYESTVPVTMDDMVHHTQAVARGAERALVVADLPFLSYQVSNQEAMRNAARLLQEGGAQAVKLEGGASVVERVSAITGAGVPVMGHLGLTPQSVHQLGGFKVQGRDEDEATRMEEAALTLQDAGAFAVVLEAVPAPLAERITARLEVPTIGIGAGAGCDGQVLVVHDMLGLFDRFTPKFVKRYAELGTEIRHAVGDYVDEVRNGRFPDDAHSFGVK